MGAVRDLLTLQTRMGQLSEAAHILGATYVTLPAIPEQKRKSLDDYARVSQAQASGVEHFFVERDMVANPQVALRRSADFLMKL
jgi:hypothetical protein